jgi:hypothetical protein
MRPNPLIATLTAISFYPFLKKCFAKPNAQFTGNGYTVNAEFRNGIAK